MTLVSDTSAIMAVILSEPSREQLREETKGADLIAPPSLRWEIGNALSAGFKQDRLSEEEALEAVREYQENIPIRFVDISLAEAVRQAHDLDVYAYDAFMIECAKQHNCPLLTLDGGQRDAAEEAGVDVIYIDES